MDTRITIAVAALSLVIFAPNAARVCADSAYLLSPSTNDNNSIHQEIASFDSPPRELTPSRQLQTCRRDDALDPTLVSAGACRFIWCWYHAGTNAKRLPGPIVIILGFGKQHHGARMKGSQTEAKIKIQ